MAKRPQGGNPHSPEDAYAITALRDGFRSASNYDWLDRLLLTLPRPSAWSPDGKAVARSAGAEAGRLRPHGRIDGRSDEGSTVDRCCVHGEPHTSVSGRHQWTSRTSLIARPICWNTS